MSVRSSSLRLAVVVALFALPAAGQELKPTKPLDAGHGHVSVRNAASFDEGWVELHDAYRALEASIGDVSAFDISSESNAIATLGARLGGILQQKDSPFPKRRSEELGLAIQNVVANAIALHIAADEGELQRVDYAFSRLRESVDETRLLAPAAFTCPRRCEGAKTYREPGACPRCGASLKAVTTAKFAVALTPDQPLAAGVERTLAVAITDPTGAPVTALDRPLEVAVASSDLASFFLARAERREDGSLALRVRFPSPGKYVLFHEFGVRDAGAQLVPVPVVVPGAAPVPASLVPDVRMVATVGEYAVSVRTDGPLVMGAPARFTYSVSRAGSPVADLERDGSAAGHLYLVSENLRHFVHAVARDSGDVNAPAGPTVEFDARFERPGRYRAWALFRHAGETLEVPFTFAVTEDRAPAVAPRR